jgi:hypothetical protein
VPHEGGYHLTMDSAVNARYCRNELTLTIDLDGYENVVLRFFAKEWNDEGNAPPTNPFTGGANFDGVAVSEDGDLWYEVYSPRSGSTSTTTPGSRATASPSTTSPSAATAAETPLRPWTPARTRRSSCRQTQRSTPP